ncbi:MAG: nucleotidyltransferase domain-containing protein [Prevotellaceae bacterium]|jgi:predicted nucleotidyltransferase|nr:nucleotidyltransferase domain-containing protein [Prevotellaceae bacterium]
MLIREKDREALLQIFSAVGLPIEVWAYGSRVDGSAHEGSDLDLAVRTRNLTPLPPRTYMALVEKIQDSTIPILVELRDWALLPESFHRNIAQQHEILFSNL